MTDITTLSIANSHSKCYYYMMKSIKTMILITIAILLATSCNATPPPAQASMELNSKWYLRQGRNECGPYSCMASYNILMKKQIKPTVITRDMKYRMDNGYTYPAGIKSWLRSAGLHAKARILSGKKDPAKLLWLKKEIAKGSPVIILGKIKGTQILHYITLLGYQGDQYYFYDSYQNKGGSGKTIDDNGNRPGNKTLSSTQLLQFWNEGHYKGFYRNYAVSVSK